MMQSSQRPLAIIPFGSPGSGKSTILNSLAGTPQYFKSSKTSASGCTQEIKRFDGPAFGLSSNPLLRIYDAPGVGDPMIPLANIVADIKVSIGENNIDASLIVIKAQDYRTGIEQMIAVKVISKFFKNFDSRHVFLIITHADVEKPSDDFIADKLASFKTIG
jgi:predicted GTPase